VLNQNKPFIAYNKLPSPSTKPTSIKNQNQLNSIFCGLVKRDKRHQIEKLFRV
jgi:hypothetical protein